MIGLGNHGQRHVGRLSATFPLVYNRNRQGCTFAGAGATVAGSPCEAAVVDVIMGMVADDVIPRLLGENAGRRSRGAVLIECSTLTVADQNRGDRGGARVRALATRDRHQASRGLWRVVFLIGGSEGRLPPSSPSSRCWVANCSSRPDWGSPDEAHHFHVACKPRRSRKRNI
jgi:hypothetical protein